MWIFAREGFVSIVADLDDQSKLLVRGRFKGDVEAVFPKVSVRETANADYRFRASVDRVAAGVRLAEIAASIDYQNFKSAAPGDRHSILMRIWSLLISEQDRLYPPKAWRWGSAPQARSRKSRAARRSSRVV